MRKRIFWYLMWKNEETVVNWKQNTNDKYQTEYNYIVKKI